MAWISSDTNNGVLNLHRETALTFFVSISRDGRGAKAVCDPLSVEEEGMGAAMSFLSIRGTFDIGAGDVASEILHFLFLAERILLGHRQRQIRSRGKREKSYEVGGLVRILRQSP